MGLECQHSTFYQPGCKIQLQCEKSHEKSGVRYSYEDQTIVNIKARRYDGKREDSQKRKMSKEVPITEREEVDELQEKHKDKIALPRPRLWARMISSGIHDRALRFGRVKFFL